MNRQNKNILGILNKKIFNWENLSDMNFVFDTAE